MKLNIGCNEKMLPGFINIDIVNNFPFATNCEFRQMDATKGFPIFDDNSVEAITISHFLSRVPESTYPNVVKEWSRILEKGGVIRITDDNHETIGMKGDPKKIKDYLEKSGFEIFNVGIDETKFKDKSLIQVNYDRTDDHHFFWIEAVKK